MRPAQDTDRPDAESPDKNALGGLEFSAHRSPTRLATESVLHTVRLGTGVVWRLARHAADSGVW